MKGVLRAQSHSLVWTHLDWAKGSLLKAIQLKVADKGLRTKFLTLFQPKDSLAGWDRATKENKQSNEASEIDDMC